MEKLKKRWGIESNWAIVAILIVFAINGSFAALVAKPVCNFFGLTLEAFTAGVVAIGMNFGAYGAEIVRGGILAVPKGQWEGAFALNFTPAKRMRKIIIPQIFPIILPPAANLTVELLKATALVALVTVVDLTFEAKQINSITWLSAQCFGTALLIYYIISRFFLVPFLRWLEVLAARKVGKEIK